MAGRPKGPRDGGALPDRDEGVVTEKRPKVSRPPKFKVILFNDDYTPMEFVVGVLEQVFGKGPTEATQLMLQIHHQGMGIAGVYVLEVAETKAATVHRLAESQGYPLRAGTEKE
jgi:ATP-dependent Clp protease adaptor protein ClpS